MKVSETWAPPRLFWLETLPGGRRAPCLDGELMPDVETFWSQLQEAGGRWLSLGNALPYLRAGLPGGVEVAGASPGSVSLVRFPGGGAEVREGRGAWSLPDRPDEARARLLQVWEQLAGLDWLRATSRSRAPGSAGGLASRMLDRFMPEEEKKSLPDRWRGLARSATHPGPVAHLSPGGPSVLHVDQRAAYLGGMRVGAPLRASWRSVDPSPANLLRLLEGSLEGIWSGCLWLAPGKWALPPLPERGRAALGRPGKVSFQEGIVSGSWSLSRLRQVVRASKGPLVDLSPLVGWGCQVCQVGTSLDPLVAEIDALPLPLRKLAYTRAWSVPGSLGWWRGVTEAGGLTSWTDGRLWWGGRSGYRPDVSWWIAEQAQAPLWRVVEQLPPGALVASHVDSLWIDLAFLGDAPLPREIAFPEVWKQEGRGACTFYRPGVYDGPGKGWGRQGIESDKAGPPPPLDPRAFLPPGGRSWDGDPLKEGWLCSSRPIVRAWNEEGDEPVIPLPVSETEGPPPWWGGWAGGWASPWGEKTPEAAQRARLREAQAEAGKLYWKASARAAFATFTRA